jgi:hypothetical protein
MRSPWRVYVCDLPERLKSVVVEPEKTAVVRQRLGKYVLAVTNTHATVEDCCTR